MLFQTTKKQMMYKKPTYMAEFGIGDEVRLQIDAQMCLFIIIHGKKTLRKQYAHSCEVNVFHRLRTKLEFHYTMDCGLHSLLLELALQCRS